MTEKEFRDAYPVGSFVTVKQYEEGHTPNTSLTWGPSMTKMMGNRLEITELNWRESDTQGHERIRLDGGWWFRPSWVMQDDELTKDEDWGKNWERDTKKQLNDNLRGVFGGVPEGDTP